MSRTIFRPIVPGMVIHCITEDEANALLNHLAELGYKWISGAKLTDHNNFSDYGGTCYVVRTFVVDYGNKDFYEQRGYKITEFSDLVLPELTAEEVIEWLVKNYEDGTYREVFGRDYLMNNLLEDMTPSEVVEKIAQWKAEHEKQGPEIETVDICRIIEIQPDGRKQCVHEEDIKPDPELPFGGDEPQKVKEILKRYCMEHDGEFIAVHEVVSRVKAVN